jgi:exodeoxyribonuclease V beta subunit
MEHLSTERPWLQPLDRTLMIEASAGTGKTWTLAMLYLRLVLEQGLLPAQILVVTFTEAATAELRARLRQRLADALAGLEHGPSHDTELALLLSTVAGPGAAEHLRAAIEGFDSASIHTLHGFCARVLADRGFSLGLPAVRDWGEDPPALRLRAIADRLRRVLESLHPLAAACFSPRSPEQWDQDLGPALEHSGGPVYGPERVPSVAELNTAAEAVSSGWQCLSQAPEVQDEGAWARWKARLADHPARDKVKVNSRNIELGFTKLRRLLAREALPTPKVFAELGEPFLRAKVTERWHKAAFEPDPFLETLWAFDDLYSQFVTSLDTFRDGLAARWITELPAELLALRLARQRLGFQDLLLQVRDALAGPTGNTLAAALRERYPAALVDEFQDTDPVQWQILEGLFSTRGNLVLVGDPKQAIYGFRGGDVHAYLRARDGNTGGTVLCRLDTCHRSDAPLIHALNTLFGRAAEPFRVPGIPYEPVQAKAGVRLRHADGRPLPALCLDLPDAEVWPLSAEGQRAECVTRSVRQVLHLLSGGVEIQEGETWRPLKGGDIALLTLRHRQAAVLYQGLLAAGIPAQRISQESVWQSAEAEGLRPVLAALLAPADPALLLGALAGGLCDIDGPALEAWHRDPERLAGTAALFHRCAALWHSRGIAPALAACLDGLGVPGALLARPDGTRALTNVRHLQELLLALETETGCGPAELLPAWDQKQREADAGSEQALLRLESDESLVQVVTVHASKGLEYPIVLAPFLWDDTLSLRGPVIPFHNAEGLRCLDVGSPDRAAHRDLALEEQLAEHLRLCYVALTRARHHVRLTCLPPGSGTKDALSVSGLGTLLLGRASAPESVTELVKHLARPTQKSPQVPFPRERWLEALEALRDRAVADVPGCIQIEDGDHAPDTMLPGPPVEERPQPRALPLPEGRARRLWVGSFTSLSGTDREHGADHGDDTPHEVLAETPDPPTAEGGPPEPGVTPGGIGDDAPVPGAELTVPASQATALGVAVHTVFERSPALLRAGEPRTAIEELCRDTLAAGGLDVGLAPLLAERVQSTLNTPLPGLAAPGCLGLLDESAQVHELEFLLPVGLLDAGRLRQLLELHQWPPGPEGAQWRRTPAFPDLRGYLKGFIDLVFQADGRWHVLDWKSNRLGPTLADYRGSALDAAMAHSGYFLQALLYGLALHRLLKRRLDGYVPEQHLGSAFYLFIRGVGNGSDGIWHTPLPVDLLLDLDRELAATQPAGETP